MKNDYDIVIIGAGVTARSFFEGLKACNEELPKIIFLQVKKSVTTHHSVVLERGGMARYWHKGLMSPGLNYLQRLNIDKNIIEEFDYLYAPNINHETTEMQISKLPKSAFIAPEIYTRIIDSIFEINHKEDLVEIVINDNKKEKITAKKLIVAASSIGNLDILSLIEKKVINCTLNDHTMKIMKDNKSLIVSPFWERFDNCIKERRFTCIFPNGVYLSPRVELLVKPYIGRILYGLHVPKLAVDAILKKIFKPKRHYTFILGTPEQDVYNYSTGNIKMNDNIVSAYHCIGEYPCKISNTKYLENIHFISGLNLGSSFTVFPTYTMSLIAYKLGKELRNEL